VVAERSVERSREDGGEGGGSGGDDGAHGVGSWTFATIAEG
jgi:hypothetical protein